MIGEATVYEVSLGPAAAALFSVFVMSSRVPKRRGGYRPQDAACAAPAASAAAADGRSVGHGSSIASISGGVGLDLKKMHKTEDEPPQ
jgi:hypothetical protein